MSSGFVLPPEQYDISWDSIPATEEIGGLRLSQAPRLDEWIVKLRFEQEGRPENGTGFFVNIPDAACHVVLTAGHNLIDKNKVLSKNLVVQLTPTESRALKHEGTDLFISAAYRADPSSRNAELDYGAILLPKNTVTDTNKESRTDADANKSATNARGFGFSLKLGHDELRGKELAVSGYRVEIGSEGNPVKPVRSTGKCINCCPNQLEYDAITEKGLSGSPVSMPYRGHETAIAIHNNGSHRGRGSKGTRLNDTVLGEIFEWAKVGYKNRSLKAFISPKAPLKDLYLRFLPEEEHAWVRSGRSGLETCFDILPAYAAPPPLDNKPRYAFRFVPPRGWPRPEKEQWVLWDFTHECVSLSSSLQELCLPRIVPASKKTAASFWIVLTTSEDRDSELKELQMRTDDLSPEDVAMGDCDVPGVCFGKHLKKKNGKDDIERRNKNFNLFCFV